MGKPKEEPAPVMDVVAEPGDGSPVPHFAWLKPEDVRDMIRYMQGTWLVSGTYSVVAKGFTITLTREETGAVLFKVFDRGI